MTAAFHTPLVERALRTAACCHREHYRKASDLPYITHPVAVAMILLRAGFDEENVLAAALLHDVVEDTPSSLEDLKAEFPAEVVDYVTALTEEKNDATGHKRPWRQRKEQHIRHIAEESLEVRAIVLADKLHNLTAMLYDLGAGDELWSRFGASPEDVVWYHRTMIEQAEQGHPRLKGLAAQCRAALERLETS